jgi:AraC-like DNA-binding protein
MNLQLDIANSAGSPLPRQGQPAPQRDVGRIKLTPIPLTRTDALGSLQGLLQGSEASIGHLLSRAGLPDIPLGHGQDLIPVPAACALLDLAARYSGLSELGLDLAECGGLASLGAYGRHVERAENLLDAIGRMSRHAAWNLLGVETRLQLMGPSAVWYCVPSPAAVVGRHQSAMLALGSMGEVVRLAAGPDWRADEVRIPRSPCDVDRLRQGLAERVLPGTAYALVFPRGLLRRPMASLGRRTDISDAGELAHHAAALPTDFAGSVRLVLCAYLRAGYPHLRDFARSCGLSVRKLQRRLSTSGTTYSKLVEQIRREQAMAMLADGRITVTEVGLELGYNESASFTRAFRRWQGLPPRDYRLIAAEPDAGASHCPVAGLPRIGTI